MCFTWHQSPFHWDRLCISLEDSEYYMYSQDIKEMDIITEKIEEREEKYLMIGGNYNARTGNKGRLIEELKEKGER